MSERYDDAYGDLGGNEPSSELPLEQKIALYRMGVGSKKMRLEAEKGIKAAQDAAQHLVNKAGAALVRQAGVSKIDRNYQEY